MPKFLFFGPKWPCFFIIPNSWEKKQFHLFFFFFCKAFTEGMSNVILHSFPFLNIFRILFWFSSLQRIPFTPLINQPVRIPCRSAWQRGSTLVISHSQGKHTHSSDSDVLATRQLAPSQRRVATVATLQSRNQKMHWTKLTVIENYTKMKNDLLTKFFIDGKKFGLPFLISLKKNAKN